MVGQTRIPLSVPSFVGREAKYLQECVESGWVAARGPFVERFEDLFAAIHDRASAVSAASGTAALHTAMADLGLRAGDEVIVPTLTFIASVNPIRYVGATPVFVDADPTTYTLDVEAVERAVGPRTRAIVAVHLYGQPVDMDPILDVATRHDLAVIEDATEALGARYRGRACGTIGDVGCFSFNGNKLITSGGGGMLLARSAERLEHIRFLTLQGRDPDRLEYVHSEVGFNYTLSNVQAAVGLAQLEGLEERLIRKRAIASRYAAGLADVAGLKPFRQPEWADGSFWLNAVLVDHAYERTRDETIAALSAAGIDSRPFFTPIHLLPPYREFATNPFPVSERLHQQGVLLPSSPSLTDDDQARVIGALRDR